jgi:hypothetical protein
MYNIHKTHNDVVTAALLKMLSLLQLRDPTCVFFFCIFLYQLV